MPTNISDSPAPVLSPLVQSDAPVPGAGSPTALVDGQTVTMAPPSRPPSTAQNPLRVDQGNAQEKYAQLKAMSDGTREKFTSSGTLSPADANRLLHGVSTARAMISQLFLAQERKNIAPDGLIRAPATEHRLAEYDAAEKNRGFVEGALAQDRGNRTSELPLHQLSPENRELAAQLMEVASRNLEILNKLADVAAKPISLGLEVSKWQEGEKPAASVLDAAKASVKEELQKLLPERWTSIETRFRSFFGLSVDRSVVGREITQMEYEFRGLVRNNPDIALAIQLGGNDYGNGPSSIISDFVNRLPLPPFDRSALSGRLASIVPNANNVVIGARLGEGATATVFSATYDHRPVAVKVLNPINLDPESFDTGPIEQRAKAVAELSSQAVAQDNHHLPRVLGFYEHDGRANLVMEMAAGGRELRDLFGTDGDARSIPKQWLRDLNLSQPQIEAVALHLFGGAARGLNAMHERGLFHLDIKCANIMLDENTLDARLIDFGMSTGTSTKASGTLTYMSAARMDHKPPSAADDVWSWGTALCASLGIEIWATLDQFALVDQLRAGSLPVANDDLQWGNISPAIKNLIMACWLPPLERPSMGQIVDALNGDPIRTPVAGEMGEADTTVLTILGTDSAGARDSLAALVTSQRPMPSEGDAR